MKIKLTQAQVDFAYRRTRRIGLDGVRFDHSISRMLEDAYIQGLMDAAIATAPAAPPSSPR